MRRAVAGIWGTPAADGTPALVVTAVFFALGGLFGCWIAFHSGGGGDEALRAYLEQFLAAASEGQLSVPAWPGLIWRTVRWPLAAFLFAFTGLGLLGVPVLSSLRGFFLAFSIASFARVYGRAGLSAAFLLLGVTGLVSIPVFLLLSVQSFSNAWSLAARPAGQGCRELPYHREFFYRSGLCAGALCVCVLMERYLVPVLLMGAVSVLS
ncbi:MAG: hypothetical protein ACOX67_08775 [Oscillospiraceae bacterium]|jgi:hypothetical protein